VEVATEKIDTPTDIFVAKMRSDFIEEIVHDGHNRQDVEMLVDNGCQSLDKFIIFEKLNELRFWRDQKAQKEMTEKKKKKYLKNKEILKQET
jgi:hypothetical protein